MQEFAATINHLTYCAHIGLPEHLVSKEEACASAKIGEQDVRWQLLFGGRRTLIEAINQALKLEAVDIAAGMPSRVQQTMVQSSPPPSSGAKSQQCKQLHYVSTVCFQEDCPHEWVKKKTTDTGYDMPDIWKMGRSWQEETWTQPVFISSSPCI
jgi:hypothetical protein